MNIDGFLDLVHTRRSIRRFKNEAVPEELLEKILEAGRWAMSGANAQPLGIRGGQGPAGKSAGTGFMAGTK